MSEQQAENRKRTYRCTICGKQRDLHWPLPAVYPFCSDRCKMVDLGRWFDGEYSIDRDLTPEELQRLLPPNAS